ncbi:MAG: thiazole synthase [Gammaproteobacteria bacterium]
MNTTTMDEQLEKRNTAGVTESKVKAHEPSDTWQLAGRHYQSRLLVGTGKYADFAQTRAAIVASGAEIVTVALRRTNIGQSNDEPNLLDYLPDDLTILPNTAGCYSATEAIRVCHLARELLDGHNLVKLEVLGDEKTLYPKVAETVRAAQCLVEDGFQVMAYTSDDPLVAKELAEAGCVAVMPLAAPIGSGLGIRNPYNIMLILEQATVPILVDAGVGTASDAAIAMELGCDGVLMNTAIAQAQQPVVMAEAMRLAIQAGRLAYRAGRMPRRLYASASSPIAGIVGVS